ncbi:MAG: metal-dependent hydrolase [Deltaproteobacteria bacterium]|nr:metal-dependent hydrolase [Deltaproteobacteria bacterium]
MNVTGESSSTRGTRTRTKDMPKVRMPKLGFDGVPRRWFAGSVMASHLANGVNLLFPAGERFFVRSVKHYLDRVDDPELVEQVRAFFGQEGRHAYSHERFFQTLREQGYDIDTFLAMYDRVAWGILEKHTPPALHLSVTVALEHFTAILAEDALTSGELEVMHPELRNLLAWHAVEELEHKAVAFDVMRAAAPSYALRMAGMLVGATALGTFWVLATRDLLRQEGMTLRDGAKELRALRASARAAGVKDVGGPVFSRVFLRGMLEYLRPSFHPMDRDHGPLVRKALERLAADGIT